MKKSIITILSLVAFIGGFIIFYQNSPADQKMKNPPKDGQQTDNPQKWETKIDDQANVTIVVTPTDLSPQSMQWKFDIDMNTHSVELDQDPLQITTLVDDKGHVYKPISWNGAGPGGHHREGVLLFNAINPTPRLVEINIKGIGGIQERTFQWRLN